MKHLPTAPNTLAVPHVDRASDDIGFPEDGYPCLVCGKPVRQSSPHSRWVPLVDGGATITDDPDAHDPAGDMGLYPVGPECLRRFPEIRPFTYDADGRPVGKLAKARGTATTSQG